MSNDDTFINGAKKADFIGYKSPPKATRFRKGQSGNPKGRPQGSKNKKPKYKETEIINVILEEAGRMITVVEANQKKDIDMKRALTRSIMTKAIKGNTAAQKQAMDLISNAEKQNYSKRIHLLDWAYSYKQKYKDRKSGKLTPPIPDPDHIKINNETGEIEIRGPYNEEHKEKIDRALYTRNCYFAHLEEVLDGRYSKLTDIPQEELTGLIEELRDAIKWMESTYPDWILNGEYKLDRPIEWYEQIHTDRAKQTRETMQHWRKKALLN